MLHKLLTYILNLVGITYYTISKHKHLDREIKPRSGHWSTVRKAHLKKEPRCQWCKGVLDLEVHHIEPFHLDPTKELVESNLITLCEHPGKLCHFKHGHNGTSWKDYNLTIRSDCLSRQS